MPRFIYSDRKMELLCTCCATIRYAKVLNWKPEWEMIWFKALKVWKLNFHSQGHWNRGRGTLQPFFFLRDWIGNCCRPKKNLFFTPPINFFPYVIELVVQKHFNFFLKNYYFSDVETLSNMELTLKYFERICQLTMSPARAWVKTL